MFYFMKKISAYSLLILLTVLASFSARAEYSYFNTSTGGSLSGSDGIIKDVRWPYWNGGYYNTWINDNWTSSDGVSGYFYNGLALPAANSPNPVNTQQTVNWSFWPLSSPINITDTINPVYSSPNTFSMQTIAEGTIFRSPSQWSFWQTNVWYRMVLRTWQPVVAPPHTGYSGTWMRDPVTGIWYHVATIKLPMSVTGITGADGFQENAVGSTLPERTDYRNCYYHRSGTWSPANNFQAYNHGGGIENAGLIENNTAVYYETAENDPGYTGTITNQGQSSSVLVMNNQPATPTFDPILVTNYSASVYGNQLLVQWQILPTSSPQFAYRLDVYTNAAYTGNIVTNFYDIDPEARQELVSLANVSTPYVKLTIIDIFYQTNAAISLTPTNATLNTSSSPTGTGSGLNFAYYQSASNISSSSSGTNWSSMPNFAALTPLSQGAVSGLDLTPRKRRNGYAFNFNGYINAPTDGLYTFTLNSDDGSKLYLDGQLVINWDGEHSPSSLSGAIALQAGLHALNVQYFSDTQPTSLFSEYFDTLTLSYAGPGLANTLVPTSAYYRQPVANEPVINLSSPTNGAVIPVSGVPLSAVVTPNGATINKVQFYLGNTYWTQDTTLPYSSSSFFWANTNNPIHARIYYNTTNVLDSGVNLVTTTNGSLAPWQYAQAFYHNTPNGAAIQGGTYSVIGDGVNLLTRQVNGDCTFIAHLASLPSTAAAPDGSSASTSWQAGIILRGNTNMVPGYPWGISGTAPFTAVFGQVNGGTYYQDESMVNGGGGFASSNLGGQKWFKLQRAGNVFTSFVSADGVSWKSVFTNTLTDFPTTLYVGFFTYAGPSSNPNVPWASFDNVSLTGNIVGPPGVTINPAADTSYVGQAVTLNASPSGNAPFYYQWQYNGVNLLNATNASLVLTNLQAADSGLYSMSLTNANGSATANATVTVLSAPPATAQILSANPIAYWQLNEPAGPTAYDTVGPYNGTGEGGIAFGVPGVTNMPFSGFGPGNTAVQFNGSDSDVVIPGFNFSTTNFSVTGWVKCDGAQTAWSGLAYSRGSINGNGTGLMVANKGSNVELRYSWNDDGADYNFSSGLNLPTNGLWAFIALTIEPTRAIIYFATNSVLQSATNTVVNVGQTFNGSFYLGLDPSSSSRRFNGTLDEIALYNRTLTPTQIGQILSAAQQSNPTISLDSPANGSVYAAPATITLNASVQPGGHTINYVQFFSGQSLLGISSNAPYTLTLTNLAAGNYTLFAQAVYDAAAMVSSAPAIITLNPAPLLPAAPNVTTLASNLVTVSWARATYASSYYLFRNGNLIATLAGTNYQDFGLVGGSNYCYSLIANNNYGSSLAGPASCVTLPTTGFGFAWDAQVTGALSDGNGNCGTNAANWWTGSVDTPWKNGGVAVIGAGATTNCIVTITNTITPGKIIFNLNNGGSYSLAGTLAISLTNTVQPMIVQVDDLSSTIGVPIQGVGSFTKTGSGSLTISTATTLTGTTTVSNGTIIVNIIKGLNSSSINIQSNATVIASASGGNAFQNYSKTMTVYSGGTLTLAGGDYSNLGGFIYLQGGATFGGLDSGVWGSWQINDSDSSIHITNGSPVAAVISAQGLHGVSNKSLILDVADVTTNANVDLSFTGTLTTGNGDNSNYGITKTGAGTMAFKGSGTYIGTTTNRAGTLLVDGIIANSPSLMVNSGATLGGTGTIAAASTILASGVLAPGDNTIGTLTITNTLKLSGSCLMEVSKSGLALTNDLIKGVTTLTCGGLLVVTNLGVTPLAAGDSFNLFKAQIYAGTFASYTLPTLMSGLAWDTSKLAVNGSLTVYAPPLPGFTGLGMASGGFNLNGTGVVGQAYVLLSASNLMPPIAWVKLLTNTANSSGIFNFADPQATNASQQFYRVQSAQ